MEMERGGGGDDRRQREEDVDATTGFFFAGSASDFYDGTRVWQQCSSAYKPPGMVRVFPFTSAQWQELQRQALIYKHIMASVPVPPDLLLPVSARAFPEAPPFLFPSTVVSGGSGGGAGFNLRFTNNTDPEPGRCRRTDGKKWRCSRDAAPDQKYCERHMHRGRPRSRKPVELRKTNKSTTTTTMTTTTTTAAAAAAAAAAASVAVVNSLSITSRTVGLLPTGDLKLPLQPMEPNKHLGNIASNQPWELMGMRSEAYNGVSSFSYPDLNDQCCSFLNPNLSALEENAATDDNVPPPRGFIDAWSTDNSAEQMPTLTLSMSNAVYDDEKTDHIQTGLGLGDYSGVKSQQQQQQQAMNWTGGPLAEVLHSSNMAAVSPCAGSTRSSSVNLINLMCKSCCGSHEASPRESPARLLASSPSGVLQKALVSLSDSSSGSSPTFAAAASRPEVAFQWMNQTK